MSSFISTIVSNRLGVSQAGQPTFFKEPCPAIMAVTLIGTNDGNSRLVTVFTELYPTVLGVLITQSKIQVETGCDAALKCIVI
ncbi:hypothetical protein QQF64_010281 [Cirrhinus molitorella]|uniref:Uncharacterized protein n=1 Tax=Cirrhinus molitorella TaxID=172907 RepID=A0ABR3M6P3_9TELE